jgi:SAM-dependent methyltransferase
LKDEAQRGRFAHNAGWGSSMTFRSKFVGAVRATLQLPLVSAAIYHRRVRQAVRRLPRVNRIYENIIRQNGFGPLHPFDRIYGTNTSGLIRENDVHVESNGLGKGRFFYAGSQPSIVRLALRTLPALETYSFVDLGSGKGRVLIIASEFPFKTIIGVECSPSLAAVGRRNVELVRRRFPKRVPVRIEIDDATTFRLPSGNLVVFLYNPFGEDVISRVVSNVEAAVAEDRSVFVVYLNPLYGHCFDASRSLTRFLAGEIPNAPEEIGFGAFESDCVLIWQSANANALAPLPGAGDAFEVVIPGLRAKMLSRHPS